MIPPDTIFGWLRSRDCALKHESQQGSCWRRTKSSSEEFTGEHHT